jgi:uncharacterized protein (DUF1810 family)
LPWLDVRTACNANEERLLGNFLRATTHLVEFIVAVVVLSEFRERRQRRLELSMTSSANAQPAEETLALVLRSWQVVTVLTSWALGEQLRWGA